MWNKRKIKQNRKNRPIDIENKLMLTKRDGDGRMGEKIVYAFIVLTAGII